MSRHFWQACDREDGFSFVELLVTMVIAGIAFAAMVPLFVDATKAVAGDKSRTVALNIAQDRIEKVRRLNFAQITNAALNVTGNTSSPFTTVQPEVTEGGTKDFYVSCVVTDLPVSTTDTRVVSKKVAVTVTWDAPDPGGSVSTTTIVYRQYSGPEITAFDVAPYDETHDWITSSDVLLTVYINPEDAASMAPVQVGTRTLIGYVLITISPVNGGSSIAPIQVPYNSSHKTWYQTTWTVPNGAGIGDGYYKFTAVAYSANKSPGNNWSFSKHIESGKPGPVRDLKVTAAAGVASLTWLPSLSGDVDHYEVYRTNPDNSVVRVAPDFATQPKWKGLGFTDYGLTVHETYTYTVIAYDQVSPTPNQSDPASKPVYVLSAAEVAAPLPAVDLKADPSANYANVMWSQSPSTGVEGYQVFANGNTTTPVATVSTLYAVIPQAWNTTAWYQVKPYTAGVNLSPDWASILTGYPVQDVGGVPWVKVTTSPETRYDISITNDASADNKKATITLSYLGPTGTDLATVVGSHSNIKYGDPATWTNQPYGKYRWSWTTTDNPSRNGQREDTFNTGTGGTVTITRHCIAVP
jgi:prepilin-type N-terminal cleavage/methylation domain-containing protein